MRKTWNVAAIAALMATPAMAQTQPSPPCLTRDEANALFAFALPEFLNSAHEKCAASLPKTSFLVAQGPQLIARHRAAAANYWPAAKIAFIKMTSKDDSKGDGARLLTKVPDDALRTLVVAGLSMAVSDDIKPADCPKADRLIEALAPLPAINLATIIVEIVGLSGSKSKEPPLSICEAS